MSEAANADEARNLYLHHLRKVQAATAKKDSAMASLRNAMKAAKGDGISAKDIKIGLEFAKDDDGEVQTADIARRLEIADYLAHPASRQFNLFDDETPPSARAFREGEAAGKLGKSCEPPYDDETSEASAWVDGWKEGQAEIFDIKAPANDDGEEALEAAE